MRSVRVPGGADASYLPVDLEQSVVSLRVRLRPHALWQPDEKLASCDEHLVYVLRGQVEALSYGRWQPLPALSAIHLRGAAPQIWRNAMDTTAELLWVGRAA